MDKKLAILYLLFLNIFVFATILPDTLKSTVGTGLFVASMIVGAAIVKIIIVSKTRPLENKYESITKETWETILQLNKETKKAILSEDFDKALGMLYSMRKTMGQD